MPYKNKEKQRESVKKAVKKHRKGITTGITSEGITPEGMTEYPSIIYDLADPIRREKLQRICDELGKKNLQDRVYYGCGRHSISMDIVDELLDAS